MLQYARIFYNKLSAIMAAHSGYLVTLSTAEKVRANAKKSKEGEQQISTTKAPVVLSQACL